MRAILVVACAALFVAPAALSAGRVAFQDTIPARSSTSVRITTHKAAAFRVVLRVPTQGRTQLFLQGKKAPRGGPLIDTKTYACEGAAGSFYCRAAYERLPKGTYTWRIRWLGTRPAHVELTVRW
jgi:hypothetical protein